MSSSALPGPVPTNAASPGWAARLPAVSPSWADGALPGPVPAGPAAAEPGPAKPGVSFFVVDVTVTMHRPRC